MAITLINHKTGETVDFEDSEIGKALEEPVSIIEYVEKELAEPPTVFIYLTDGIGEAPEKAPDYPVIWCLTGEGQKPADWGLEVRINSGS